MNTDKNGMQCPTGGPIMTKLVNYYSWFVLAMVFLIVTNVLGRYFFDLRFDFAVDVSWQLYGIMIIMGCSHALSTDSHIRTDVYWNKFSDKVKARIDFVSYLILFFPAISILTYKSIFDTIRSVAQNETSSATMAQLIVWPLKIGITLGLILLLYQGAVNTRKCFKRC